MPYPILGGNQTTAQADLVAFTLVAPIGAAGAVTASGVKTTAGVAIARSSAGVYTLTLPAVYQQIVFPGCIVQQASGAVLHARVASTATVAGKTVLTFNTVVTAGTATDPANGDILRFYVVVTDSSVVR